MKLIVGFSIPKKQTLKTKILCWWMNTPYCHVYIRWDSSSLGDDVVYEATMHNVSFILGEDFDKLNQTIKKYEIETDRLTINKISANAIRLLGSPYSIREILQILLQKIPYLKFGDSSGYICSELVGQFLSEYFNFKFNKPHYLLTPKDIEDILWPK